MSLRYYRINVRRMTVGECRRMTLDTFTFLVALLAKVGFPTPLRFPPAIVPTRWHPTDELPEAAARRTKRAADALAADGFRLLGHGRWPIPEPHRSVCQSLYISPDRVTGVAVTLVQVGPTTVLIVGLTTRFRDGTFGITIDGRAHFDPPADQLWRACPGVPPEEMYAEHRRNLVRWEADGRVPEPFADRDGFHYAVELGRMQADELVERGVYIPMTDDEVSDYLDAVG